MNTILKIVMICIICAMIQTGSAANNQVTTIRYPPDLIPIIAHYNETNLETVQHFINHLDPCPWRGACGIHARYFSMRAKDVGLDVDEITIRDRDRARVKRTVMDGHRVNTFMDGDVRYYTVNLYAGDNRIVTRPELHHIIYG